MKARTLAILALALPAAVGCRTDPRIAPLERELRLQEDRIYELQDQVAQYEQELAACQARTTVPVGPAITQPAVTRPAAGPSSGGARSEPSRAPAEDRPGSTGPGSSGALGAPKVELPARATPPGRIPPRLRSGAEGTPSGPDARETPKPDGSTWHPGADNRQVARITLNGLFTGGYDADGHPGDEGVAASIEPRDARGRLIAAAAPVSVVLLDPAEQGQSARIARWDFSAEEIAAMSQAAQGTEGIHLAMDWPDSPPAHGRLHLFVRYTTDDGRKLEADQEIAVDIHGRQTRRWKATSPQTRPAEPIRAAARPTRRADPVPLRARPVEPAVEPSEPTRRRPTWSPYR